MMFRCKLIMDLGPSDYSDPTTADVVTGLAGMVDQGGY